MVKSPSTASIPERIQNIGWEVVTRVPDLGPCWEWKGGKHDSGYALLHVRPRMIKVHRFMLEQKLGRELTAWALHRCDNPPCIRPEHLFEGDALDNNRDRVAKGRTRPWEFSPRRYKFSDEQVQEMRAMWAGGQTNMSAIARHFGASQTHVSNILRGKARP